MNKYENVKVLGEGGYGKAILARQKSDGQMCVIKEVRLTALSAKDRNEATKEAKVLASLKHPNIVKYINSFQERGCFYIVMEYCDGGDLSEKIEKRGKKLFSEEEVLHYFIQIALAIKYIHDRKILHRDLKAQNIFLTKSGGVKLGDFGISRVLEHTFQLCRTQIGTPYYLSPEICQGRNYNSKTDIWSLGCILYELCTLKHAFQGGNMKGLMMNIVTGKFSPISNTYSRDLHDLVNAMLTKETDKRPSINEILKRPFIQSRLSSLLDKTILDYEFSHTIMHGRKPFAAPTIVIGHNHDNEINETPTKPEQPKVNRPPNPNQSSIKKANDKNRSSSEDRYGNRPAVRQQQYNFPSNVDPRYARNNNKNHDDYNRKPNNDRLQYQQQQQMLAKQREEQDKERQRQIQELKRLHREDEQRARDEAERIRKQKEKDAQQQRERQRMEVRKQREIEELKRAAQEREKQKRRMEQQQKELDEMRRLADQQRKKEEEMRRIQMEEYRRQEEDYRKRREEEKRIMRNHAVEEERRQAEQLEKERLAEVEKKRKEMEEMVRKRQHEAEELKRQQEQKRRERMLEQQREREELEQERIKIAEEEKARRKAVLQKQRELREQQKREQEERRNRQQREIQNAGLHAKNERPSVQPQSNANKHYQQPSRNETFVTAQDYGTPDYDPLEQTSADEFISRIAAVNQPAWVKMPPKRIPIQLDETLNEGDQTALLESCQSKDFFNFLNNHTKEAAKSEETLGFTFADGAQRPAWAKQAPQVIRPMPVIDPLTGDNVPQPIPPSKSEESVQKHNKSSRILPDHILHNGDNDDVGFSSSDDDEERDDREIDQQIKEKFIEEDANNLSALHDLAMSIKEALDMPDVKDHKVDDDHGNEQTFYVNDKVVKLPVATDKESLARRQNAIKTFLEQNIGRETLIALNEELIHRDADDDSPTPIISDLPPGIVCLAQQWLMLDSTSKDEN